MPDAIAADWDRVDKSAYLVEVEDQVELADIAEVMIQNLHKQMYAL